MIGLSLQLYCENFNAFCSPVMAEILIKVLNVYQHHVW